MCFFRESRPMKTEGWWNSCATEVWGILGYWKVTFGKRVFQTLPPFHQQAALFHMTLLRTPHVLTWPFGLHNQTDRTKEAPACLQGDIDPPLKRAFETPHLVTGMLHPLRQDMHSSSDPFMVNAESSEAVLLCHISTFCLDINFSPQTITLK